MRLQKVTKIFGIVTDGKKGAKTGAAGRWLQTGKGRYKSAEVVCNVTKLLSYNKLRVGYEVTKIL